MIYSYIQIYMYVSIRVYYTHVTTKGLFLEQIILTKQVRKRPLDTPKRMIERREREGETEKRER